MLESEIPKLTVSATISSELVFAEEEKRYSIVISIDAILAWREL